MDSEFTKRYTIAKYLTQKETKEPKKKQKNKCPAKRPRSNNFYSKQEEKNKR